MRFSWIIFTLLLVCAYEYLNRKENVHVVAATGSPAAQSGSGSKNRLAGSMQAKINYIEQNGSKAHPDQRPTVITEEEANDYLASGQVKLPQGVNKVTLEGQSGQVNAFLVVDFDKIRENQNSSNPLLGLFTGVHNVKVESDAAGSGGIGKVHVKSVYLDGTEIPHMALEYFVEKYVTAKYPNIGMDSQFRMPDKIDVATVGYHKLTVTQK